jgi:LEA14-like dessication related protein
MNSFTNFEKKMDMKTTWIALVSLFVFTAYTTTAQTKTGTVSFEKTEHDFGKISEEKGSVTYEFKFTNTGGSPVIVSNVKASCGCTTPDWSKDPILPGKSGFVKATYDPKNRPGAFSKSVTVTSNAENSTVVLIIKGDVIPRPRTIEDDYPQQMGNLRMKSNHLAFTKVNKGQLKTDSLGIVNTGTEPVTVTFDKVPAHITIKTEPATLKPNQKGRIVATYDPYKVNDWGFIMDRINVLMNNTFENNNLLSVSATIEEDFSNMTPEQKANAPKATFETTNIELGDLGANEKKEMEFRFTNTGKTPLIIRKVKAACGCTAIAPSETEIAPGKSSSVKATFDTTGRSGKQSKTITVITNDPENSTINLRFSGEIK